MYSLIRIPLLPLPAHWLVGQKPIALQSATTQQELLQWLLGEMMVTLDQGSKSRAGR